MLKMSPYNGSERYGNSLWTSPWLGLGRPRPACVEKQWKTLGFPIILSKNIGKPTVFHCFSTRDGLGRPKPDQGLVQRLFPYPSEPFYGDILSIQAEHLSMILLTHRLCLCSENITACLLKKAAVPSQAR